MKHFPVYCALILFSTFSFGQLVEKKTPLSGEYYSLQNVRFKKIQSPQESKLKSLSKQDKENVPFTFAYPVTTDISPLNAGLWTSLADTGKLWTLGIEIKDAYSLNIIFEDFKIPDGSQLFIFNPEKSRILGAFTQKNNKESGFLPTTPVPGDKIVIEYYEPLEAIFKGHFVIGTIGYDFTGVYTSKGKQKEHENINCQVNINCPEGDDWQYEKRAVCKIIINGTDMCTGALINNARQDGAPYVLTANHCINSEFDANKSIYFFNYESDECYGFYGPLDQSISGSGLLATAPMQKLDFSLIQLSENPPAEFRPYFAGWDKSGDQPQNTVSIHHADGGTKKISIDDNPAITGNYGESYLTDSHWLVRKWEVGVTEVGSSGGPLFNEDHHIIGDLTGGPASCSSPRRDFFAKLSSSWDSYSEQDQQLAYWLDPDNSGISELDGFEPYHSVADLDAGIFSVISPRQVECLSDSISPEIKIINHGKSSLQSLIAGYAINGEQITEKQWTGNLPPKETITIKFDLYNMEPGDHAIDFYIRSPNGLTDELPENDTVSISFRSGAGNPYLLSISTDNYGYETSWEISNFNDQTIYSGMDYVSNKTIEKQICLQEGCYVLTFKDIFGDGLCCKHGNGSVTLTDLTSNETVIYGGVFNGSYDSVFCVSSDFYTHDIAVDDILYPPKARCNSEYFQPAIVIRNIGNQPAMDFDVTLRIDAGELQQVNYTDVLPPFSTDTVYFPENYFEKGEYLFAASAHFNPKNTDKDLSNNDLDKAFRAGNCKHLQLVVITDSYGQETTWILENSSGEMIYRNGPYRNDMNLAVYYHDIYPQVDECYSFTIYDKQGDGLCCKFGTGRYYLLDVSANDTLAAGSDFGAFETTDFCLEASKTNGIKDIKYYPNPAEDFFIVEQTGEQEIRVELIDLYGQVVFSEKRFGTKVMINIPEVEDGIYLVRLKNQETTKITKVLISGKKVARHGH